MIVQAGHQLQALATGLNELLATTVTDLFQRLDAVGDEGRTHHQQLLHALRGQLVETALGIGLDPLGATQT